MITERRGAARVSCNLPSSFRDLDDVNSWSSCFVTVKDISRSGMRLKTHKSIPLTATLIVAFVVPGHRNAVEARVAPTWTSEIPGQDGYETGVRFLEMDQEAKHAINAFC